MPRCIFDNRANPLCTHAALELVRSNKHPNTCADRFDTPSAVFFKRVHDRFFRFFAAALRQVLFIKDKGSVFVKSAVKSQLLRPSERIRLNDGPVFRKRTRNERIVVQLFKQTACLFYAAACKCNREYVFIVAFINRKMTRKQLKSTNVRPFNCRKNKVERMFAFISVFNRIESESDAEA